MTRQELINAITAMLEEADFRALRLIWVATRRLTAKPVTECPLDATPPAQVTVLTALASITCKA